MVSLTSIVRWGIMYRMLTLLPVFTVSASKLMYSLSKLYSPELRSCRLMRSRSFSKSVAAYWYYFLIKVLSLVASRIESIIGEAISFSILCIE